MIKPSIIPNSDMNPAIRPCVIEREMRYIIFGPGEQTIPSETSAKQSKYLSFYLFDLEKNLLNELMSITQFLYL